MADLPIYWRDEKKAGWKPSSAQAAGVLATELSTWEFLGQTESSRFTEHRSELVGGNRIGYKEMPDKTL